MLVFVDLTIVLKLASAFVSIMDALNEGHNMKRSGSGRSYTSLVSFSSSFRNACLRFRPELD